MLEFYNVSNQLGTKIPNIFGRSNRLKQKLTFRILCRAVFEGIRLQITCTTQMKTFFYFVYHKKIKVKNESKTLMFGN